MAVMSINLTPELEKLVREKVTSGRYHSASEVVRDALRLLEEQDLFRQAKLAALRGEIQKGLNQLDRGEGTPWDAEEFKKKARARRKTK